MADLYNKTIEDIHREFLFKHLQNVLEYQYLCQSHHISINSFYILGIVVHGHSVHDILHVEVVVLRILVVHMQLYSLWWVENLSLKFWSSDTNINDLFMFPFIDINLT